MIVRHGNQLTGRRASHAYQRGASLVEFLIVAMVLLLVGMLCIQLALIYQAKLVLNYATFEAARAGAVAHAQLPAMRRELGIRLSPLAGGGSSASGPATAIALSSATVHNPVNTSIELISPSLASFDDWGKTGESSRWRYIPNNHLRYADDDVGSRSGLTLRDANLLRIRVVYGIELKVPLVGAMLARGLSLIDPDNAAYYARQHLPLVAIATVRMQSEAWEAGWDGTGGSHDTGATDMDTDAEPDAQTHPIADDSGLPDWESAMPVNGPGAVDTPDGDQGEAWPPDCLPTTHTSVFDSDNIISTEDYLKLYF